MLLEPARKLTNLLSRIGLSPGGCEEQKSPERKPDPPPRTLSPVDIPYDDVGILQIPAQEMARQVTLIEHAYFRRIRRAQVLNKEWKRERRMETAEDVCHMILHFNSIACWAQQEVLGGGRSGEQTSPKQRAKVLELMLTIANELRGMHNFNACCAILSGLSTTAIYRLKKTWQKLPSKTNRLFEEELKPLLSTSGNHRNLRQAFKAAWEAKAFPMIPPINIFLQDLFNIHESAPTLIDSEWINWTKMKRMAAILKQFRVCQRERYNFTRIPAIQEYIERSAKVIPEAFLWQLSVQKEPPAKR